MAVIDDIIGDAFHVRTSIKMLKWDLEEAYAAQFTAAQTTMYMHMYDMGLTRLCECKLKIQMLLRRIVKF